MSRKNTPPPARITPEMTAKLRRDAMAVEESFRMISKSAQTAAQAAAGLAQFSAICARGGGKSWAAEIIRRAQYGRCDHCMATGWQAAARACHMRGPHMLCGGDKVFPNHRATVCNIDARRRSISRRFYLGMWASVIGMAATANAGFDAYGWPGIGLGFLAGMLCLGLVFSRCARNLEKLHP